jgi:SAM-dependent methyltransferase
MARTNRAAGQDEAAGNPLERLLACPICRAPLARSIEGVRCAEHGLFSRHGRLLSFISGGHSEFDRHWELAQTDQRPQAKVEVARNFLKPLLVSTGDRTEPLSVLDVGCGDGVHVQELLRHGEAFSVAGLDYSVGALASATQLPGDWLPLRGDARHLPFADDSFDAVISFGVLAYLDNPERGLSEIVRVTRPGGLIGLWYAPQRQGLTGMLFKAARCVVPRLPRWGQMAIANALVPFLGLMPTSSGLSLRTGSWRECREVILVNLAPSDITFPTRSEIEASLTALNCRIIPRSGAIDGEYWAHKGAA